MMYTRNTVHNKAMPRLFHWRSIRNPEEQNILSSSKGQYVEQSLLNNMTIWESKNKAQGIHQY